MKSMNLLTDTIRKIVNRFAEPPIKTENQRLKLRHRFIFGFTLVTCAIFFFAQIIAEEGLFGIPIFSLPAIILALSFFISRRGHLNIAIIIDVLLFAMYPYFMLFFRGAWSIKYSVTILIWIPITMLIAGYLLNHKVATAFIIAYDILFLKSVLLHPGTTFFRDAFLESVIPVFAISLLISVGFWTRERQLNQLDKLNRELEANNRELNIYTSLLVHDIGNDLQVSLTNTELSSHLLVSDPTKAREHILTALAVEQRMSNLLKIFSQPSDVYLSNIVGIIERTAAEANETHGNMEISIIADDQCKQLKIASRLLPMVFTNLFRNSAIHAGAYPKVTVEITADANDVQIVFDDNGHGIDSGIRDNIFERGTKGNESNGAGIGLYLVRQILKVHQGSISLLSESESEGCGFLITLPLISFFKDSKNIDP